MDVNNKTVNAIEIIGELNLAATTGHNFTTIRGNGKIRLTGDNFRAGTATDFASATIGGTVEIYGTGTTINQLRTFNHLVINLTASNNTVVLKNNLNLNGNFTIQQGVFQINDDISTGAANRRIVTAYGNLTVEASGSITVGTGIIRANNDNTGSTYGDYHQSFHQMIVYGDFVNSGTIRLTNLTVPDYKGYDNTAASLVMAGASNSSLTCNGITDLYNLVVDKGVDQTYEVALSASAKNYFALFGKNNNSWNNNDGTGGGNPETQKALWIKAGTLRLTGKTFIPSLTEGGNDFQIGANARLLLDGSEVIVHNTANEDSDWTGFSHGTPDNFDINESNQGLYAFGKLQIDNGYFLLGEAVAISFRDEAPGQIEVNGGELSATQIALSNSANNGIYTFTVNGGTVRLTDYKGRARNTYAMLHLNNSNMVFNMSGGEIIVEGVSGNATNNGILIGSGEGNYSVTGGSIKTNYNGTVKIGTTAPFFNLDVINGTASLQSALKVLGNVTIASGKTLNANSNNMSIGNDLTVNGTYTTGTNTTTFNGNARSIITLNGTKNFHRFVVAKDNASEVTEVASGTVVINNELRVEKGTLKYNTSTLQAKGNVYNAGTIGVTGSTGKLLLNGAAAQTLTLNNGIFGNIDLNNTNGATIAGSNMIVTGTLTLTDGVFDINTYKLTMQGSTASIAGSSFGTTKMIQTAGNASDGGLEMYVRANGAILFPMGTNANSTIRYTPATATFSNYADDGYVQINVADLPLATTNLSGGNILSYYWRVRHRDFTALPVVQYTFTYANSDTHTNAQLNSGNNYVPGKVLDEIPYTRSNESGVISGTNQFSFAGGGSGFTLEKSNYTAGVAGRFSGNVQIYYSIKDGDWGNSATWSRTSHSGTAATDNPKIGDVAIIGYSGSPGNYIPHRVRLNVGTPSAPRDIAELILLQNPEANLVEGEQSRLIISPTKGLAVAGKISGDGEVQIRMDSTSTPTFTGDFGEFANTNGASWIYHNESNSGSAHLIAPAQPTKFPRLSIEGNKRSVADITSLTIPVDIECQSMNVRYGGTLRMGSNILVKDSLRVGTIGTVSGSEGHIIFRNTGQAYTLTVQGDLSLDSDIDVDDNRIFVEAGGTANLAHRLLVGGNIRMEKNQTANGGNGGYLDLFTAEDGAQSNVILELNNNQNAIFTNATNNIPDFYRIVVNKGANQNASFSFNNNFVLNGATNGTSKAVELQNGTLILNDPVIAINLSTGGANFAIPATAALEVTQGTVNISGDDTGIALDGTLRINGGVANIGNCGVGNGNNYIEYSTSGNALLEISSGSLTVGSQVRRSLVNTAGILKYRQTGGTVVIGSCTAPNANRGMLEVLNTGSEFTHTGGNLTIVRQNGTNPTVTALLLEPATFNTTGSTINVGNVNTPAGQGNFGITSSVALGSLVLNGTSNPNFAMRVRPLTLNGALTISNGATLSANGLTLTLNNNLVNNGTFVHGNNTTIFSGTATQQISGTSSTIFYNLTKSANNTLSLASGVNATVAGAFRLQAGTFNDGGNTLTLLGDMLHDGTHLSGAGTGQGILFAGSSRQELSRSNSGSSTFGKVTIDNPSGVLIPNGNGFDFSVTNVLRLKAGVFDIGGSLLEIQATATIEEVNTFGAANMIQTNSSFTDNGVQKHFNTISTPTALVFPIGHNKYTPVWFNLTSSSAGSLKVRPANEIHPSIVEDVEAPDPEIVDRDNALKYHWIIKSNGLSNFNGEAVMTYSPADVAVTTPYTVANYIPAQLFESSTFWNKAFSTTDFDEVTNKIYFTFSNATDATIAGHYTAGVGVNDSDAAIKGAIPDQVPEYETAGTGGVYTATATWTPLNGSPAVVDGEGPIGAIIIVRSGDNVALNNDNVRLYRTEIEAGSVVEVNGTIGHRLGEVSGSGTLRLASNTTSVTLPAGFYNDFFACSGGGLEYTGSGSYEVLAGVPTLRHLTIDGSVLKKMPNNNFTLCEDLLIKGTATLSNEFNRTLTVQRDILLNGGAYNNKGGTLNISRDLTVAGGTFNGGTGGSKTVGGNLTVSSGAFQVGSNGTVNLQGDLSYSGGTFSGGSGNAWFVLNGMEPQTIVDTLAGTIQFHRLEVNNTSTDSISGVILAGNVDVNTELKLTQGLIHPDTFLLKLNQAATANQGADTAYVDGPLYKVMANGSSFTFPVGKGSRWGHIGVLNVSSGSQTLTWKAEYFNGNAVVQELEVINLLPLVGNIIGELIETISQNEYWKVSDGADVAPSGPVNAQIRLRWDAQSDVSPIATDHSYLRVMVWNNDLLVKKWVNYEATGLSEANKEYSSGIAVPFSEKIMTSGSTSSANPLPVELLSFTAKAQNREVLLTWETASETNNDFFEVHHSADGKQWTLLGTVDGHGNSAAVIRYTYQHGRPVQGVNYYRLKQVDFDGRYDFSHVVSVTLKQEISPLNALSLVAYPNPVQGNDIYLRVDGLANQSGQVKVQLMDMFGKRYVYQTLEAASLAEGVSLQSYTPRLAAGLYLVSVQYQGTMLQTKLIVK